MKVILQRVSHCSVEVEGRIVGQIARGLLLLCGIGTQDCSEKLAPMAKKISELRIFPDEKGRFHHSLLEVDGGVLLVPQFTLFADTSKGRRPEFFGAMKPPLAEELFLEFFAEFRKLELSSVEKGIFGANMQVLLANDGPVTICLEN